jgi:hypothetical protein
MSEEPSPLRHAQFDADASSPFFLYIKEREWQKGNSSSGLLIPISRSIVFPHILDFVAPMPP